MKNAERRGAPTRDSYSDATTQPHLHLSRNGRFRTPFDAAYLACSDKHDKHAVETKWDHRDSAIRSPAAQQEFRRHVHVTRIIAVYKDAVISRVHFHGELSDPIGMLLR